METSAITSKSRVEMLRRSGYRLPMSGATVPLWVTITLGVLAVLGTIGGAWGGQFIAARSNDRRWEREVDREDLRWRRELERESQRREHEDRLKWMDVRLDLYSEIFSIFSDWSNESGMYTLFTKIPEGADELPNRDFEHHERFQIACERARLIASQSVVDALRGIWLHSLARTTKGHDGMVKRIEHAREIMRAELGVVRSINPSQSSGPTS